MSKKTIEELDKDTVHISEIPAFKFAAFEVKY